MSTKTSQKNITATNVAARDLIEQQINADKVFFAPSQKAGRLQSLLQKFRYEYENNLQFREEIDELTYFRAQRDSDGVVGLENKLKAGERSDLIDEALEKKELFARKLGTLRHFKSAQRIFAYCLGRTEIIFKTEIGPMIQNGSSHQEIDNAILTKIYDPLLDELEGDEELTNYLLVQGMLFYLTGTCHVKWHK